MWRIFGFPLSSAGYELAKIIGSQAFCIFGRVIGSLYYSWSLIETVLKMVQRNWWNSYIFINRNRWDCFMFLIGPNEIVSILFLVPMKLFRLSRSVIMKLEWFHLLKGSYWNCFTSQKDPYETEPFLFHRSEWNCTNLKIFIWSPNFEPNDPAQPLYFTIRFLFDTFLFEKWNSFNKTNFKTETVSSIPINKKWNCFISSIGLFSKLFQSASHYTGPIGPQPPTYV